MFEAYKEESSPSAVVARTGDASRERLAGLFGPAMFVGLAGIALGAVVLSDPEAVGDSGNAGSARSRGMAAVLKGVAVAVGPTNLGWLLIAVGVAAPLAWFGAVMLRPRRK